MYTTKSHRGTVIGSTFIYGVLTLFIGTNKGYVIQVKHMKYHCFENFAFNHFCFGIEFKYVQESL